jgi:hypothetical protein
VQVQVLAALVAVVQVHLLLAQALTVVIQALAVVAVAVVVALDLLLVWAMVMQVLADLILYQVVVLDIVVLQEHLEIPAVRIGMVPVDLEELRQWPADPLLPQTVEL